MRKPMIGAIGLSIGLAAGACSAEAPMPTDTIPQVSVLEAPVEALNKRLGDVTQFIGPIATTWESCPVGGTLLYPDTRINAYIFNNPGGTTADGVRKIYHTVEIRNVSEYRDAQGNIAAWCGSTVDDEPRYGQGADPSVHPEAIVVIPAMPGCEEPEVENGTLAPLPCPGMPITIDKSPGQENPGPVELIIPEPATPIPGTAV